VPTSKTSPATSSAPTRVAVFTTRANQAVCIPKEMSFPGVKELEVRRIGDVLTMRPVKPSWESFFDLPPVDDGILADRRDVVESRPMDVTGQDAAED